MKQPLLQSSHYPNWLSDIVAFYLRTLSHRGQFRILGWLEKCLGLRRWNPKSKYGFRIGVDRRDVVQLSILREGEWDPEVAAALLDNWEEDDVFFDIGANIGYFSLLALQRNLSFVVAFEPFIDLADLAEANLSSHCASDSHYQVERVALGAQTEMRAYSPGPPDNSGAGKLIKSPHQEELMVEVLTLDEFLATRDVPSPTIMKLDVEGFEKEVLQGARNLLSKSPPHTIIFEANCEGGALIDQSFADLLSEFGYGIHHLSRKVSESKENFLATHGGTGESRDSSMRF